MLKEREIADGFINGSLNGVVIPSDSEYAYLALRLTGTGITERLDSEGKARLVNRKLENFATPEFMKEYENINIVFTHPKDKDGNCVRAGIANGGVFVGNTIASFLKGEEIWVIGRIHSGEILDLIVENAKQGTPLSTSPHFTSTEIQGEDGVFIEIPQRLNSLAIVSEGFWDKKATSPAIEGDGLTLIKEVENTMAEEKIDTALERSVTSTENKSDEKPIEEKVADLEKNEAKEAEQFQKLAEEHKTLEEGEPMEEDVKQVKEEEIKNKADSTAEADEAKPNLKEEEKADGVEDLTMQILNDASKSREEKIKLLKDSLEVLEKADDDLVKSSFYDEDDEQRDVLIKEMKELADEAPSVKIPMVGTRRVKPEALIKLFAKVNPSLVPDKYNGMVEKIDSSVKALAYDMYQEMVNSLKQQNEELKQKALREQSSGLFNSSRFMNR